jgi:rhodanese-related sulfurtransferase
MGVFSRLFGGNAETVDAIDVLEAQRRHAAGALLVDVRNPDEWQAGHAPQATLIPLGALPDRLAEVPRDRDVLLICRSGNRSGQAQRLLLQHGFTRVLNVSGGMNAWTNAGLPVQR